MDVLDKAVNYDEELGSYESYADMIECIEVDDYQQEQA